MHEISELVEVALPEPPVIHGLRIRSCTAEYRETEAKVVFHLRVNERLRSLINKILPRLEQYGNYARWHGENVDWHLTVIVSYGNGKMREAAVCEFTLLWVEALKVELASRSTTETETSAAPAQPAPRQSLRGTPPPCLRRDFRQRVGNRR